MCVPVYVRALCVYVPCALCMYVPCVYVPCALCVYVCVGSQGTYLGMS